MTVSRRKVAVNVTTPDESGRMVTFPAGTEVSAEVAKGITNPRVWADEPEPEDKPKRSAQRKSE